MSSLNEGQTLAFTLKLLPDHLQHKSLPQWCPRAASAGCVQVYIVQYRASSLHKAHIMFSNMFGLVTTCAGRFATLVCSFCERLDDPNFKAILGIFKKRLEFGVKAEVLPLMDIKCKAIAGFRAGILYRGGLCTPADVAQADEQT